MSEYSQQQHYRQLGSALKKLRLKYQQSIAEVSGSVEVDVEQLASYENGEDRPSEEILLLLISHFDLSETMASKLWQLAGYHRDEFSNELLPDEAKQASAFVLLQNAQIVYSDVTHAAANQHGIVLNFMQSGGPMGKPLVVSRLGLSREHAKHLVDLLNEIIEPPKPAAPKLLAPPKNNQNRGSKRRRSTS